MRILTALTLLALTTCTSRAPIEVELCAYVDGQCECPGDFEGTVCGDYVDDDCDGADEACPTTNPASIDVPSWNCTGAAPANVYAFAHFSMGDQYFRPGGCFVFFEGLPSEFYVSRVNLTRVSTEPSCETSSGCVCPSLNDWPSYDRRLYAFTLHGDAADCAPIVLVDHAGTEQAVSNECRKYLYQLHAYDIDYSYVAGSEADLNQRLSYFPTVEIACAQDSPHQNLPFQSLSITTIERNPEFRAK